MHVQGMVWEVSRWGCLTAVVEGVQAGECCVGSPAPVLPFAHDRRTDGEITTLNLNPWPHMLRLRGCCRYGLDGYTALGGMPEGKNRKMSIMCMLLHTEGRIGKTTAAMPLVGVSLFEVFGRRVWVAGEG